MTLTLGGPGLACSTMTLRRLAAGELDGERRARAEAHLSGCARCQAAARGLEAERRDLAAELPFEQFAAGVAERLAGQIPARPALRAWGPALPLALAAGLALAVAAPLLVRLAGAGVAREDGSRVKGGATAALHVPSAAGSRTLGPDEPVPAGAPLRLVLSPAGRRFAAAALVDEDGVALLLSGPASTSAGAFEWTGRRGRLVVVLDDRPVDGAALVARLRAGRPAAPDAAAEVIERPLRRGER